MACGVAFAIAALVAACAMRQQVQVRASSPVRCEDLPASEISASDLREKLAIQRRFVEGEPIAPPDLSTIRFTEANVVTIREAHALQPAILRRAMLVGARFEGLLIEGLDFSEADLTCAHFSAARLGNAFFRDAVLDRARLVGVLGADHADFRGASLDGVNLTDAQLAGATIERSSLIGAIINRTNLSNVSLAGSDLSNAFWSPSLLPPATSLVELRGLATLRPVEAAWRGGAVSEPALAALGRLRILFREVGERDSERQVTRAYERARSAILWSRFRTSALQNAGDGVLWLARFIVWDVLTDYTLAPWRPTIAVLIQWLAFAPLYAFCKRRSGDAGGIAWVVRKGNLGVSAFYGPYLTEADVAESAVASTRWRQMSLYLNVSFVATSRIGFGPINLGEWVTRLRKADRDLVLDGPLRTLAGVQSLLSTTLFTIWLYALLGRPFD